MWAGALAATTQLGQFGPMENVYVASSTVEPEVAQQLLLQKAAVWCPPPLKLKWALEDPETDTRTWILHRDRHGLHVLGAGHLLVAPKRVFGTQVLWSRADVPRARLHQTALSLGYQVPATMTFLRLQHAFVVLPTDGRFPTVPDLASLPDGMSALTAAQQQRLEASLR